MYNTHQYTYSTVVPQRSGTNYWKIVFASCRVQLSLWSEVLLPFQVSFRAAWVPRGSRIPKMRGHFLTSFQRTHDDNPWELDTYFQRYKLTLILRSPLPKPMESWETTTSKMMGAITSTSRSGRENQNPPAFGLPAWECIRRSNIDILPSISGDPPMHSPRCSMYCIIICQHLPKQNHPILYMFSICLIK